MSANYPPGMPSARSTVLTYECRTCETEWDVRGVSDMGAFDPNNEDDTRCPGCGAWWRPTRA